MKRWFAFLGVMVLTMFIFVGCEDATTALNLSITSHPQGGENVSTLSCTFQGELETYGGGPFGSKDAKPITATVEWWWEDYFHENDKIQKTETYTFTSKGPTTYTTTYSAPSGYILLNYWWVKIKWTDEDGTSHEVESGKAFCYSSGKSKAMQRDREKAKKLLR